MKPILICLAAAAFTVTSCANTSEFDSGDAAAPATKDAGPADDTKAGECPAVPCPGGFICHAGLCQRDHGPCTKDDDCSNDSFCNKGRCLPYGPFTKKTDDQKCKGGGFGATAFTAPSLKCEWTKTAVIMAPVVADLDGDKKPEIVFITFSGGSIPAGSLVAIRGDTCKEVFAVPAGLGTRSQLAIADLDGDKKPEIIGIRSGFSTGPNNVVVFDNKGKLLATAPNAAKQGASTFKDGGPAIANLDGASDPEIVYAGQALRYKAGKITELYNVPVDGGSWGVLSAIADVDLDGFPEVLTGNRILNGLTGADKTPAAVKQFKSGYVAIAQFDKSTPEPEIVLISSQRSSPGEIRIFHPKTGKVIFGPYQFGQRWGGPPTVADFDGDGQPEVGSAGYAGYVVFDQECTATPLPKHCAKPGIRWEKTTRDRSSGSTGSSVFDFNGDLKAEVVYRDECWLRVYDGNNGTVRFAANVTSGTILELPVIADTDNDGRADIVVPSHRLGGCQPEADLKIPAGGGTQGILVLQDPKNRWMASRAIWNQHSYHITNVNDDATIPLTEKNNWATWNNYRQNTQGIVKKDGDASDLTGGESSGIERNSDCKTKWVLAARLCNRGAVKAKPGIPGTFYSGDPTKGGTKICSSATKNELKPGACEVLRCDYKNPPKGPTDLWFRADDDGTGRSTENECKEKNNTLHVPKATCKTIG